MFTRLRFPIALTVAAWAMTLLFWWPMFGGAGLIGGDIYPYFLPQKAFYADRLKLGEFPLWNDSFDEFGEHTGKAADELQEIPSDIYFFESVRRFKGLESPYVIALDLPEKSSTVYHYVAGTRATAGLKILR